MTETCSNCGGMMETHDSYREYVSTIRYRAVTVYKCRDCEQEYHKKGTETIA